MVETPKYYQVNPESWKLQKKMVEEEIKSLERILNDPNASEGMKKYARRMLDAKRVRLENIKALLKALGEEE